MEQASDDKPIPCEHWQPDNGRRGVCAIGRFDLPSFGTCAGCLIQRGSVPPDWKPVQVRVVHVSAQHAAKRVPAWRAERIRTCAACDGQLPTGQLCTIKRNGTCATKRPQFVCPLGHFGMAPIEPPPPSRAP